MSDGNIRVDFRCEGSAQSIVVNDSLTEVAQAPTPPLPSSVTTVRGTYPGLQVNLQTDLNGPAANGGTWYVRWESLPHNQDQPRTEWPQSGSGIELVRIG